MKQDEIKAEIATLEERKRQAEALFLKCDGGIEVLNRILEKSKSEDKPVAKKEK
tara:strand:+ start:21422 stop:21583 length:162 start_codon:yes stop_codon:yes gene_type:complete